MPVGGNQAEEQATSHPKASWQVLQQWNEVIFAHWPVEAERVAKLLPEGLEVDCFAGSAWLTVMAFQRTRVRYAGLPSLPCFQNQPEINLQLCVRERFGGQKGYLVLSKDAAHPFSFIAARCLYRIPAYWAEMYFEQKSAHSYSIYSRRRFSAEPVFFSGRYRSMGPQSQIGTARHGSLEEFLMERYCMYLGEAGTLPLRYRLLHQPCVIERAEAEFERNDLARPFALELAQDPAHLYFVPQIQLAIARGIRLLPATPSVMQAQIA